jgi:predicted dienelactone hydrolase
MSRLLPLLACLVSLAAAACSSSDDSSSTPTTTPFDAADAARSYAERGPYGVGVTSATFVDTSRATAPNGEFAGAPDRSIPVEIWYPAAASAEPESRDVPPNLDRAPFPLIVFAHGYTSFGRQSASFAQHLASRGYVVAAPTFPGSNIAAAGGPRLTSLLDQPADVSFVLDELLARNDDASSPLAGAIDGNRVGMAGHSYGGVTTMLIVYGEMRDERIDAGMPIAPVACPLPPDYAASDEPKPMMILGATQDRFLGPGAAQDAYDKVPPPKYLMDIEGADHTRFGDFDIADTQLGDVIDGLSRGDSRSDFTAIIEQLGDSSTCEEDGDQLADAEVIPAARQRELLRIAGASFFDAHLRDDAAALTFVQESLSQLEDARYESQLD